MAPDSLSLCWRAVERYLFPTAGSSAVRRGERIERVWRDMSMFVTHAGAKRCAFVPQMTPEGGEDQRLCIECVGTLAPADDVTGDLFPQVEQGSARIHGSGVGNVVTSTPAGPMCPLSDSPDAFL